MKISRGKQIVFSLVIIVSFFLVLELRQRIRHPHVGFRGMTNSMGFRSPEFNPEKQPGVSRILFIGSSTTFGVVGPVEKTYPFLVGEILKTQMPQHPVEAINAAFPGKSSYWEARRVQETLYLKPDVIVVMTGYNDSTSVYNDFIHIDQRGDLQLTPWYHKLDSFISSRSVFYVTLREKIAILLNGDPSLAFIRRDIAWEKDADKPEWFRQYPKHFRNNLEQIVETASQNQIKLVFIKPPLGSKRRHTRPLYTRAFERLMEELLAVGEEHQIPVIDLDDAFTGMHEREYIGRDGLHFTDTGNLAIAKKVGEFFLQHQQEYFP